jgi:membrane-associated phospholipid phosphatase
VALAFAVCPLVALTAPEDPTAAIARGRALLETEQALGLWVEPALHAWARGVPGLMEAVLLFYVWAHVPATVGALVWAWLERPAHAARARDAFLATQALVVAGYLALPTAPPRLLGVPGLEDPMGRATSSLAATVQSPYAAFPSGHVAFALIAGGIVATLASPRWVRVLAVLYPLLVLAVVLVSANHFWLDAVGGAAAAALGVRLSGLRARARARATAWDGRTCRRDRLGRVGRVGPM